MLRIDPAAIELLPADQQTNARELLAAYEDALRNNPLIGYEPHPKQTIFHGSQEPLKAFFGGNRSGKTTAGIVDDVIQAIDRSSVPEHLMAYKKWEPPFHCRIVCPDFKNTLEEIFNKLRAWTPRDQLVGGGFEKGYEKTNRVLRFKNGSFFDFLTFEQDLDKFGGSARHRLHYDEEPPQDIRNEGMMRLIDYGGDELFTMTPFHGMNWMYDEIWEPWTKATLLESTVVTVDMDDNPHLDQKTKERALRGLSREERQARKEGKFVHFEGMVYDEFSRNWHVIPEIDMVPKNAKVYVGIDPGIRHMAAVVWAYVTPDDRMVVFDELPLQGAIVKQVCEAIRLTNQRWGAPTESGAIIPLQPAWYVIDPAAANRNHQTGRSDQVEYMDNGIVTILGQNSVTAGIDRVRERLQSKTLMVTANCQELINEFRKYRWAKATRTQDDPKEKVVKTDDHLLDALRYVVMSRPYANPEVEKEKAMSPMERQAHLEISGRAYQQRQVKGWQFA